MKTKILAAAVLAAIAGTAAAQSNVTLYGRINTSLESQKFTGESTSTVMQDNSSRWGIKGSEALGNGMEAFFQLESGFSVDTGRAANNGGIFNREAFMGLTSALGTVRFGRITSPVYFASADYISMHNHDTGTSSDALFDFGATGGNNNNSVTYKTPSFAGGDIEIAYSFAADFSTPPAGIALGEKPGSKNERNFQIAYNGVFGPLHLGAGYAQMTDKQGNLLGQRDDKNQTAVIRGLYEIGAFTVGGYYERSKISEPGFSASRNNFRVSGMYVLGNGEFHANYGLAGDLGGFDDTGADQWTLGYNYNLSKRTKVYTFYTQIKQDKNTNGYIGGPDGAKFSSFALGLRHNF